MCNAPKYRGVGREASSVNGIKICDASLLPHTRCHGYDYDTQAIEIPKKWLVTITQGRSPSSIEAFPQKSS
jgi:hypothetical protein